MDDSQLKRRGFFARCATAILGAKAIDPDLVFGGGRPNDRQAELDIVHSYDQDVVRYYTSRSIRYRVNGVEHEVTLTADPRGPTNG